MLPRSLEPEPQRVLESTESSPEESRAADEGGTVEPQGASMSGGADAGLPPDEPSPDDSR